MKRFMLMLTLVLAGELIFGLPFHTARFFRPTFLEVFAWSNTQLGDAFAVYGVTAMLAYYPGGAIADRYPPRLLMTLSLFATAAGGVYMATFPGELQMLLFTPAACSIPRSARWKLCRQWHPELPKRLRYWYRRDASMSSLMPALRARR